jgi:hypothetical protein
MAGRSRYGRFAAYSITEIATFNLYLTRAAEGSERAAVDFQP